MYVPIVIALMLAFPLISIVAQMIWTDHGAVGAISNLAIAAKWYAFWAVGVRLSLAGINHCFHRGRNRLQNLAMVSNLFAALVLATCCLA